MARIVHYGTKRHSGRYPWGSGKDPYQSGGDLLQVVNELRREGMSEVEIARGLGMSTKELRERKSLALAEKRGEQISQAQRLKEKGYSNVAIGERMGVNESTVRSWLDPVSQDKAQVLKNTSDVLKGAVDDRKYIDVGAGVEQHMGISRTKLNAAVRQLQNEGYEVYYVKVKQLGTDKYTSIKVLAPPGTPYAELSKNRDQIKLVDEYSEDGGRTFLGLEPVTSVSGDRILIRYGDEGGSNKDGVIELRPGVADIDLGDAAYAQVRMGVDGKYYMKGMAMNGDKFPPGIDIIYNTNKPSGTPAENVYKEMTGDPDNPFGATIRQKHYVDADGNIHVSALNMVGSKPGAGEEGAWGEWSKTLSSQILSKQRPSLAEKQLSKALDLKMEEFEEIMSLTNPTVKRKLLQAFADEADAAAVDLKAAALPRQANQVLLPFNSIKETEVYAPNFDDGERVVLIRLPHGGIFEIPELTVNNNYPEPIKLIGRADDAVGINPKVANRLSGADFDGDTVIVIPNKSGQIKTAPALKDLKDFDPIASYPAKSGMKRMTNDIKQLKMGDGVGVADLSQGVDHVNANVVVPHGQCHGQGRDSGLAQPVQRVDYVRPEIRAGGI